MQERRRGTAATVSGINISLFGASTVRNQIGGDVTESLDFPVGKRGPKCTNCRLKLCSG